MTDEINKDMVDYRDQTPFDDTKLNSISEISKGIRHKYFGKDTREALAQQGEALVKLMQETGGNQSAEVKMARGNFDLLPIREDAQDEAIYQTNDLVNTKADMKAMNDGLNLKRDKGTKIKRSDLDTSSDANKIGLNNLSEKVQKAMAGTAPVISSVANKSLTADKYADGSVGLSAAAKYIVPCFLLPSVNGLPSYNVGTGVLDFKSTNSNRTILSYGYARYQIPAGTTVVNTTTDTTGFKLVFNIESHEFRFDKWDTNVSIDDMVVAFFRKKSNGMIYHSASFQIAIDDAKIYGRTDELPVTLLSGRNGNPIWDESTGLLTFPASGFYAYDLVVGNTYYSNAVSGDGLSIQFQGKDAAGSSAQLLMFDTVNKSVFVCLYNQLVTYGATSAVLGTVRAIEGKWHANFKFNYDTVKSLQQKATPNPIDAKIKGICHRGYNTVAPEESRSAYVLAKQRGYVHWEGDINWTKDNVPVMIHDSTINRTARNLDGTELTETVKVADLNYADLDNYDFGVVKGEIYKGEPLMTFEELVKLARYHDTFLHIELKSTLTQEQLQMLHNIVIKYNMSDRICWQSFIYNNLSAMMNLEPTGLFALLTNTLTEGYIAKLSEFKTSTNTIIASLGTGISVADMQRVSDAGYPIFVWTIDTGDSVRKYRDIGMVEGLITNGAINVADELKL